MTHAINLQDGTIPGAYQVIRRYLSDLQGLFADPEAEKAMLAQNPLLYEVHEPMDNPETAGDIRYSTTILYPGKVGDEYFMTKGHYHSLGDRPELYYGLSGEGYLLCQSLEGEISAQRMYPGALVYAAPYWGHRSINTGKDNLVMLAVYPADAGHDYKTIADEGFAAIVVERNGTHEVVPNPRYKRGRA
ncbi:MAG: glucose-6-phosphate isomerase [Anaerolineae bacterium]|nr:glucose-6-phosphate isomerase [Anaerolineae bacterium]